MKKIIILCSALILGGFTLSTVSAATAIPAVTDLAAPDQHDAPLLLTGGGRQQQSDRWGGIGIIIGDRFGEGFGWYPRGYYKGFCYDYPAHRWCTKYFFKRY